MQNIGRNSQSTNNVEYVNVQVVADYYGVTSETVKGWIKQGAISGKQCDENPDQYLIPKDEFDYLKTKRDQDDTERDIQELLGDDFLGDWEVDLEE